MQALLYSKPRCMIDHDKLNLDTLASAFSARGDAIDFVESLLRPPALLPRQQGKVMKLDFVPLLQLQRDLYRIPRGMARFRQYLRTIVATEGQDLALAPLVIMNPMAKEHVAVLLDALLALDAEGAAARAVEEASAGVADVSGEYKVGLVVADDLKGGWTNRYASEFGLRFENKPKKYPWISCVLWSSESASAEVVRETVLTGIYRLAYIQQHGSARTLRERMAQEGCVMTAAGCTQPALDPEDLEYTREVIVPYLDATDMRTAIEILYGDAAGRTLGFTPRGLSDRAGLALALHDARAERMAVSPAGSAQ